MRILTFGWDYPPATAGGLGVACQGLTEELLEKGTEVLFVLPRKQPVSGRGRFLFASETSPQARAIEVTSRVAAYQQSHNFLEIILRDGRRVRYGRTIIEEVYRYANDAREIASRELFDLIHAHDWTSYLAGLSAREVSGKPLVLHVHATAFDQAGSVHVDPTVYAIERECFHACDAIVAVSNYTKEIVATRYGVPRDKIEVVHNGIIEHTPPVLPQVLQEYKMRGRKIILYHGRITIQKGVDYFVRAARRVVDVDPNVLFVISGSGDMEGQIMNLVGSLGLSEYVLFPGALWGEERDRIYQAADLLVMPSVSEPFGLVALEALQHGTPVLISKQSGVAEVLTHALKVDFWDVEEMASKMLAAIDYPVLREQLVAEGKKELGRLSWRRAAEKVLSLYRKLHAWFHKRSS